MWRRFQRRTFAPRRPAVFGPQWPLLVLSLVALVAGIWIVVAYGLHT